MIGGGGDWAGISAGATAVGGGVSVGPPVGATTIGLGAVGDGHTIITLIITVGGGRRTVRTMGRPTAVGMRRGVPSMRRGLA